MGYIYVPVKEVKEKRAYCSDKLNRLKQALNNKGWDVDFSLVGSGSRNLVTKIEGQGFDLDYNLEIKSPAIGEFVASELKNYVMQFLNEIKDDTFQESFKDCQDSTSAITARLIVDKKREFSFDVAILAKNKNGDFCRLIHDKTHQRYYWTIIPNSKDLYVRFDALKEDGYSQDIREVYLEKKNLYLSRNDESNHPSFVVFAETVNEVYSQHYGQMLSAKVPSFNVIIPDR